MKIYEKGDILVRDAEAGDILDMMDRLRPEEVAEVWASHHYTPRQALEASWENSTGKMTFLYKGEVVGMFGVVPESLLSDRALVWLLTTDLIYKMKIAFLRASKKFIPAIMSRYGHLHNFVDARNVQCLKWLAWAGALIYPPELGGAEKIPFHYFTFGEK